MIGPASAGKPPPARCGCGCVASWKKIATSPGDDHWPRQLALFDTAHIGTLHSFCLKLVREHFHEAGLDPQLALLDEGEAGQLEKKLGRTGKRTCKTVEREENQEKGPGWSRAGNQTGNPR
jgi:superfamily I DNA/RNA helicase